jgi:hypothetical protein
MRPRSGSRSLFDTGPTAWSSTTGSGQGVRARRTVSAVAVLEIREKSERRNEDPDVYIGRVSSLGESPPTMRRGRWVVGFLQVRGSVGMASGPGMMARLGEQQTAVGFSGTLQVAAVAVRCAASCTGNDRGLISLAVRRLRIDR